MRGVLRAELLKLRKRPAPWVLLAVLVVTQALFGYATLYAVFQMGSEELAYRDEHLRAHLLPRALVGNALGALAGTGGALALILGALAMGSEFRWGTLKTIVTQGPSRLALGGGKLVALASALGVFTAVSFLVALGCSTVIAALEDVPVVLPSAGTVVAGLGAGWLLMLAWGALGFLLATALRGAGLAVGLGLVYQLVIEGLLVTAVPWPARIGEVLRAALIGTNAGALGRHFGVLAGPGFLDAPPVQAAAVLVAYLMVFVLLALLLLRRRDIL